MILDKNVNGFDKFPELLGKHRITNYHILHIGAHQGQEVPHYIASGTQKITLVEPNPKLAEYLVETYGDYPGIPVINIISGACSNNDTIYVDLAIMRESKMSTVTNPHPHDNVIKTIKVKNFKLKDIASDANILVVDVQGIELDVLKSGDLSQFDLVVVQTCTMQDPTVSSYYNDVLDYMVSQGFQEVPRWTPTRSYDVIAKWSRGNYGQGKTGGQVFDSTFIKAA